MARINKECIDHNVLRLINAAMDFILTTADEESNRENIATLSYINGVTDLANELKKVLDA